jgi:hypothetical protein
MALRFAFTRPDGGTTIVSAAPKEFLVEVIGKPNQFGMRTLSDEDYRDHVIERSIPADATNVIELPADWTPPDEDRAFRNAWEISESKVGVNLAKARLVFRDKMRQARAPLLQKLDEDYLRADETGDTAQKTTIASAKTTLRNVTTLAAIDAAKTVDELRATWPENVLGANPVKKPTALSR